MHLKLLDSTADYLKKLALKYEYGTSSRPSVTKLMTAMGFGNFSVIKKEDLYDIARQLLRNNQYELAEELSKMGEFQLYDRGVISEIKDCIENLKPFRISYCDAAEKEFVFDCSFAKISTYENKQYLEVAFINEVESDSIQGLEKNRILRLDRIPREASVYPLAIDWSGGLNSVPVEFKLFGNLAYSYSKGISDKITAIEGGIIVKRYISNDFFFLRQCLRYGDKCVILSPAILRYKMRNMLAETIANYS